MYSTIWQDYLALSGILGYPLCLDAMTRERNRSHCSSVLFMNLEILAYPKSKSSNTSSSLELSSSSVITLTKYKGARLPP